MKWSFDRAVSVGGFPTSQMKAGGLEKPGQFEAVSTKTFRVHQLRRSKLILPDLAVPVPLVINSKLVKQHVTQKGPGGTEYLHHTPAGSGTFKVERRDHGGQLINIRDDARSSKTVPPPEGCGTTARRLRYYSSR